MTAAESSDLIPRWATTAGRLIRRFRYEGTRDELLPFLEQEEVSYRASVAEVALKSGGECGHMAQESLYRSALIGALGGLFAKKAMADTPKAAQLARTAVKFLESAERMKNVARSEEIRIARSAPQPNVDPYAAFRDVEPEESTK